MIDQISVCLESEQGAILKVLSLLAKSDINVLGLCSKDNTEFGTLRLILSDTALGLDLLRSAGYVCRKSSVLGIELDDAPGALENMLACITRMNINIDYLYVGYARENGMPLIMVHCEYADAVEDTLRKNGYVVH